MIERTVTIIGKKYVLKVSRVVLDKMINVLETDGGFFDEQFKLNLGISVISDCLITIIKENSDLTKVICGTCGGPDWEYFLANYDIKSEKEISGLCNSEKICYVECGISVDEVQ